MVRALAEMSEYKVIWRFQAPLPEADEFEHIWRVEWLPQAALLSYTICQLYTFIT